MAPFRTAYESSVWSLGFVTGRWSGSGPSLFYLILGALSGVSEGATIRAIAGPGPHS